MVLALTPREALGAIASPHFFLEIARALSVLCRLARLGKTLKADAMSLVAMMLFDDRPTMLHKITPAPPAVRRRGCGSLLGYTYRTLGSATAVS